MDTSGTSGTALICSGQRLEKGKAPPPPSFPDTQPLWQHTLPSIMLELEKSSVTLSLASLRSSYFLLSRSPFSCPKCRCLSQREKAHRLEISFQHPSLPLPSHHYNI
ncbi:UNVERIFIED_CONTAM: hypothetical protein K2H54_060632 [Gekko kuhli]